MRIRTITVGVSLTKEDPSLWEDVVCGAAKFVYGAREALKEGTGLDVQTVRITTNSFESWAGTTPEDMKQGVARLVELLAPFPDLLINIGPASKPETTLALTDVLKAHPMVTATVAVGCSVAGVYESVSGMGESKVDALGPAAPSEELAKAAAEVIVRLSKETTRGEGNFNFAATFQVRPGIPYFPAGYHSGPTSFAVGFESASAVVDGFAAASTLAEASANLKAGMEKAAAPVVKICEELSKSSGYIYDGIDASIAPSPDGPSLVSAYEKFLPEGSKFGSWGSIAISGAMTSAIKSVSFKTCGYTGLMLPPLEDKLLAERATQATYTVTDLLMYSTVCGIGLDTVPIPGDVSVSKVSALIQDIAMLAFRLSKPLSCRLFPVPGKAAGEVTEFDHPHMCNAAVFHAK